METINIKTKGMMCKACETLVKEALYEEKGVKKAEADHKSGNISITYDESLTNQSRIQKMLKREGYEVLE